MNSKVMDARASEATPEAAPAVLGLRARGKERRRNRIKEAARAVFVERGYEAATTREIAERAEVSLGTLFAYAPTKSELLLMIVNDDLEALRHDSLVELDEDIPLIDVLTELGRQDLVYWSKHPEIARQARREIAGVLLGRTAGPEAVRFAAWKPKLLGHVAALIERKQAAGRLSTKASPELVADLWWAVYNQNLHNWLMAAKPNPRQGVAGLRRLLMLAVEGLGADEQELGGAAAANGKSSPAATARARKRSA